MQTVTIPELLNWQSGMTIPQTTGFLKSVSKRKEGTGRDGNGTFQTGTLIDGNSQIKIKSWDRDDLSPLQGRKVWLIAAKGENGKLGGLTLIEEEYPKGTFSKVIDAKGRAAIVPADRPQPDDDQIPGAEVPARTAPPAARPATAKWQPLGQTVGMAINNACANLTARNVVLNPTDVWEMASDILRVAERLEKGIMAPLWSERHKQTTVDEIEPPTEPESEGDPDWDVPQ